MKKYNVAFIGLGYWGVKLLNNIIENDKFNVKYICEIDNQKIEYINNLLKDKNLLYYTKNDYKEIPISEIDAVFIATPISTHFELVSYFAPKSKYVFVEKPLFRTNKEVDMFEDLMFGYKKNIQVGTQYLYNYYYRIMKKHLKDNKCKILSVHGFRANTRPVETKGFNCFWDLAPHDLSMAIDLFYNEVTVVDDIYVAEKFSYHDEDCSLVSFRVLTSKKEYKTFNFQWSWNSHAKIRHFVVMADKFTYVFDETTETPLIIYGQAIDTRNDLNSKTLDYKPGEIIKIKGNKISSPIQNELDAFHDFIDSNVEPPSSYYYSKHLTNLMDKL
jgi:predicted dehydrogenase